MTFKIPEEYERKWSCFDLTDGVLKLTYKKDNDEGVDSTTVGINEDGNDKRISVSNL